MNALRLLWAYVRWAWDWPAGRMVAGLRCPQCRQQHEDTGIWRYYAHKEHLCSFCQHTWTPEPYATRGVGVLELFNVDTEAELLKLAERR